MNETTISKTVDFSTSIESLWDLLTNPEKTKAYMFGSEIHCDWKQGSPLLWNITDESGESSTIIKGTLVNYQKSKEFTYTMFVPTSGMEDIPDNYIYTKYELSPAEEGSRLIITQWGFDGAADGQKRHEDSLKGWDMVIPLMKDLVDQ